MAKRFEVWEQEPTKETTKSEVKMTEKRYFYQNKLFSVEDDLFYENDKRIGYFEDEEECEIKINNYKKTVDRLEELREKNIDLKRLNKNFRKENEQLKQQINRLEKQLSLKITERTFALEQELKGDVE